MIRQSTISLAAIGFLILLLPKAQAQTELNGPTSWDVIGNTFSQPNVSVQVGKKAYGWYGSGDVNNDEKIDSLDLEAMNSGIQNDMADIDGDGVLSTQSDKNKLTEFLNGNIPYLPGHWNELKTPSERISWLETMIKINDAISPGDGKGWVSAYYTTQMEIEFYGISNIGEFLNFTNAEYEIENNARFNIPMYFMQYIHVISGISHSSGGVLVGREISQDSISFDPLEFKDWYFVGYENYIRIFPGDRMDPNKPVRMNKSAYVKSSITGGKYFTFFGPIIEWSLNNGEDTLKNYFEPLLLLKNPNIIKVRVGPLEDLVVDGQGYPLDQDWTPEFLESLGYDGVPDTTKENTALPINLEYLDSDTTRFSESRYEFVRKFIAWIYSGGIWEKDSTSHKITIDNLTSADDVEGLNPREFEVYQNYPNPFNPSTIIKYQIANAGFVTLEVFNSLGEVVATLINEFKQAGTYQMSFNGSNLPSGVYLYILKSGNFIQSKKMILLR